MRLLCIANPEAYQHTVTDMPLSYARLAAHPDVELYHADTRSMLASGPKLRATRVAAGFMPDEFGSLAGRSTEQFAPEYFDLAFCRTLKPFPDGYLKRLQQWSAQLPFVNDPAGIQRQLEPEFFLAAAGEFTPPALITADQDKAGRFLQRYPAIVAKRANSCGGRGVYRIAPALDGRLEVDNVVEGLRIYDDFPQTFAYLSSSGSETLLLMRYLPRVIEGDKRIVVVDGEVYGAYLRKSPNRHWVQNVSTGGHCQLIDLAPGDQQIIDASANHYRKAGIHILGYDLLRADDGSWQISEINAGNIGGLFRLEYLGVPGITDRFVGWLNALSERKRGRAKRRPVPSMVHEG